MQYGHMVQQIKASDYFSLLFPHNMAFMTNNLTSHNVAHKKVKTHIYLQVGFIYIFFLDYSFFFRQMLFIYNHLCPFNIR